MVVTLDPPAAETASTPKKRGGGPRTLSGRNRSRENSVKSSLQSKVVFSADMAARILERNWILDSEHYPKTRYQQMLIADMALSKARIDRCAELQIENENRYIDRTLDYYEHDQRERALKLRKRLSRDPEGIGHALSGFKQGVELKISLWQGLASALVHNGDWDEQQRQLSLDLCEVPIVLRVGLPLLRGTVDQATMAATAAREIARLNDLLENWLDEQNEYSHDDALKGLAPEFDPTTKRLQRYERMSIRDYEKAFAEFQRVKAEGEARCKEGYVKSTLRAWDRDALITRIMGIKDPPGLLAELADVPPPTRLVADAPASPVAVIDAAPPAADAAPVITTTPTTAVEEPPTAEGAPSHAEGESGIESPTLDTRQDSTNPPSAEPVAKAPLSRRARKLHQKRLREGAKRKAGG